MTNKYGPMTITTGLDSPEIEVATMSIMVKGVDGNTYTMGFYYMGGEGVRVGDKDILLDKVRIDMGKFFKQINE